MSRSLLRSALAIAAIFFATTASAELLENSDLSLDPAVQRDQITALVEEVFEPLEAHVPRAVETALRIIDCESDRLHLDENGNIILNAETKRARGVFQFVPNPHNRAAAAKGLNLDQVGHQVVYAISVIEWRLSVGHDPFEDWRPCL